MPWVGRGNAEGAATVEYLTVAAIVCALVVALISAGLPAGLGKAVAQGYERAVCRVVDTSCPEVTDGDGRTEPGSDRSGEHEGSGDNPVVSFFKGLGESAAADVSGIGGLLKSVGKSGWHVIKGIGLGAWNDLLSIKDVVVHPVKTFNGIKDLVVHSTQQSLERFHQRWQRGDHIGAIVGLVGDYLAVQGGLVSSLVVDDQVIKDWKNGHKAQAVGRVIWNVGSFFIPGAGWALRAGEGLKAASVAAKAAKAAEAAGRPARSRRRPPPRRRRRGRPARRRGRPRRTPPKRTRRRPAGPGNAPTGHTPQPGQPNPRSSIRTPARSSTYRRPLSPWCGTPIKSMS